MSDKITTFPTGAIRDSQEGKTDFVDVISWIGLGEYGAWMQTKQSKYGAGNFHKGIPIESAERSLIRHMHKYFAAKEYVSRGVEIPANLEPLDDQAFSMIFNLFCIVHERAIAKASVSKNK